MPEAETICSRFHHQVERLGDRVAMRYRGDGGDWRDVTWSQYGRAVREAAAGLAALGVGPGERCAILSRNRPEWHVADVATMCAGGTSVPVYVSSSPSQVAYVAGHSDSRVVFVGDEEQLLKVEKRRDELPSVLRVVVFDGRSSADGFVLSWDDLLAMGRDAGQGSDAGYEARWRAVQPDDVATIVYTSGTTGNPKGAVLTHANVMWTAGSLLQVMRDDEHGRRLSYLPLAHIAERVTSHFTQIYLGSTTWFAESIDTLVRDLQDCRPNVFFAVPRVYEKMHQGILAKLAERSEEERAMAEGLLEIARAVVELRQDGEEIAPEMGHPLEMAEQMMFAPLRQALGLAECTFAVSGAAPINPEVLTFFHAVNLPIAEVYGQTEGCGPTSLNPPDRIRIGTVGPPIPGVEVRIAEDGEILVRGGNVFQGYFKDDAATEEALAGGWLHSGDVGRLEPDGYLVITDRKKDLIITAGGKNVAPQEIESRLKYHPLISQAVVHGDRRPYLVALITLDQQALASFAAERSLQGDPARLSEHPEVLEQVAGAVDAVNSQYSRAEQVRRWTVLPRDFLQEEEEVTPTLKVRRRAITERYAEAIEALYAG
jgi:long-chain acyl-CoA synthetase